MANLMSVRRGALFATIALSAVALASSATATTMVLTDFETPAIPPYVGTGFPTNYIYTPTTVPNVTFSGAAGIQSNGSGWEFPNAPQGDQTAFLQAYDYNMQCCHGTSTGSFTVAAPGLVGGNEYDLAWYVVGRPYYGTTKYTITDDGLTTVQTLSGPSQASWVLAHHLFVATGSDSFTFSVPLPAGLSVPPGGAYDHSIGVDYVTVTPITAAQVGQTPGSLGSLASVPEPVTWATIVLGFFGLGGALRARPRSLLSFAAEA